MENTEDHCYCDMAHQLAGVSSPQAHWSNLREHLDVLQTSA